MSFNAGHPHNVLLEESARLLSFSFEGTLAIRAARMLLKSYFLSWLNKGPVFLLPYASRYAKRSLLNLSPLPITVGVVDSVASCVVDIGSSGDCQTAWHIFAQSKGIMFAVWITTLHRVSERTVLTLWGLTVQGHHVVGGSSFLNDESQMAPAYKLRWLPHLDSENTPPIFDLLAS